MKKLLYILFCALMLSGCSQKNLSYDEVHQKLTDSHIEIALMPIDTPHVMYIDNNETWLFVMNEKYEIINVVDVLSDQYVYGKNAVDSDKYNDFIKNLGLSQDQLNEFAKLYYQNNIEDVKTRAMED